VREYDLGIAFGLDVQHLAQVHVQGKQEDNSQQQKDGSQSDEKFYVES
jgi:hypothetical protein